jgi:hypothetical protein
MRRLLTIACLAVPLAGPAAAEPYDIPWFLRNPSAHDTWLRRCANDTRLNLGAACQNARAAQMRRRPLGQPLPNSGPTPAELFYGVKRT